MKRPHKKPAGKPAAKRKKAHSKKIAMRERPPGWRQGAHSTQATFRDVRAIKIGKRHRKDRGDIAALARDIDQRGLLHPIVIDRDDKLIAGARRLEAWGLSIFHGQPIPCHIVPLEDIIAGEWAENDPLLRKDFTPSEAVDIKRAIEARLKPAAKARQVRGKTAPGRKGGKNQEARSGDKASAFAGKSRRTIAKAEAIVDAAKAEPAKYGKLKADMDKTGRVDGPFKRLQTMQAAEQIRQEPPPLPGNGPYRGIVADPPWPAEPEEDNPDRLARGYYPYPTMSIADIAAVGVGAIAHDDCVLGLWITNFHLVLGHHLEILKAWDFKPITLRSWVKDRMGRGQVLRGQTEHCIIATRGKPVLQVANIATFFHAAVDKKNHSRKPKKFYDDFERLVAAPRYATLFETVDRGAMWDGHGDKIAPAAFNEAAE